MSGQNAADSVPAEETEMVDKSAQNGTDPAMDAEAPRPDPRRRFSRMHSVSKHPSPTKLSWLQASLAIVILFLVVVVVVLVGVMVSGHADDDALVNGDGGADNDHDGEDEQLDLRLPDDVVPVTYDLKLQTFLDPSQFRFTGTVVIQIVCKASTSVITLHAKDLAIDEAAVSLTNVNSSYPDPRIDGFANDTRKQQFSIRLENGLDEGQEVRLAIPFRGKLRDDLSGFYLSEHVTPEGETKYLASTQFQPTAARKAFPCFDEPLFKARFKLTLIHETGFNSLSNAAKVDRYVRDDGWIVDVYEPTVKMSTYLVAFVVCDFASKEATSESGVVVRVWARKDAIEQANYALQVATKTLTYFEDYFHLQFPLSKLEIVAVPDHAFSAMENWGLILFQESKMLLEDNVSSLANKEYVVLAVSHELAHQWFGNLVTAKWWDDLWLNEGFASFVAQLGIQNIDPSSSMDERLIKREFPRAMVTDSLTTSHPIFATVNNPEQIGEIFDAISYSKGAAIVRMMSYFLGDDVFRDGLKKYLDDNKYGNTVTNDLWDALTDVAQARGIDVDVASIMNVWIHLTGYPVVTISRNSTSGEMMAEQERFLLDRTAREKRDAESDPIWPIPLTITTESEKQWDSPNVYWLKTEKMNLSSDDLPSNSGWFIGNIKREGYYRVNYDSANWERLIKQLNDDLDAIHHINRATLIDDAYWLSRAGYLDQQTALRISEYMHKEKAYLPWELMLNTWKDWGGLLAWSSGYGEFKKYIRNFLEQQYDLLGWDEREGEAAAKTNMRSEVLKMACQFGHGECTYQAQLLYSAWMRTPHSNRVPANYRSFVYCTAIRQLGVVEWEFAWSQFEKTSSASEKTKLIEAMGCSKEPWLLNRYLNLALESPEIRGGNVAKVISAVSQTAEGRFYAWKFVVGNWADIRKKYGENQFIDRRIIKGVTKYFSTAWELKELEAFVKSLGRLGSGDLMWRQAIEKTRANVRWLEANEKIIEDWVTEKNQYRR